MAELDFSKIFASTSPLTPYTWSDSDYMTGWNTVGGTPPARTQFDALQNMTDRKLKYLNDAKAPIDSPTFTGTPKAPTPAKTDNSTRIATTAWGQQWVSQLQSDIATAIASIDLSGYAKLISPNFQGVPLTSTAPRNDFSGQIANTKWVGQKIDDELAEVVLPDTGDGYIKFTTRAGATFAGEAMLQYGDQYIRAGGTVTVTLPINFGANNFLVLCTTMNGSSVQVTSRTTSSFSLSGTPLSHFSWIAIGRVRA